MLKNISSKALSTVVLILIVIYGFFKIKVRIFFSGFILTLFDLVGYDSGAFASMLNEFSQKEGGIKGILGWLLFYPTYYFLHIAFISLLFAHQKKVKNYLITGLTLLIATLVMLSILGKIMGFQMLYQISYDAFQKLFGLPFILLFIEGGRILYKDIFEIN